MKRKYKNTHRHHIIPLHMGGPDTDDNLIEVSIPMHAELHRWLWLDGGNIKDKIAWLGLSGQITKEEVIRLAQSEGGKKNKGVSRNKGKDNPMYGRTGENSPHWGKTRSDKSKEKTSTSLMGNTNAKGLKWYHHPELGINKRLKPEQIPEHKALGYIRGRGN